MISVVTWLWRTPGYRSTFHVEHVNALARMVAKHYQAPHRFVCVTNVPGSYDSDVELVADREDFADVPSPHGGSNPSCYRRLRIFAPDAGRVFGERIVSLDLDCVITSDLRPLWDRPDNFVIWRDPISRHYCGSMMMVRAGARPMFWTGFNPAKSPASAKACGYSGSDQAWIRYIAGSGEATWERADGVYSFRVDLKDGAKPLPADARICFFHGRFDPWSAAPQRLAWVREHWGVAA